MSQSTQEVASALIDLISGDSHYAEACQLLLDQNAGVASACLEHLKVSLCGNYREDHARECSYFLQELVKRLVGEGDETRRELLIKAVDLQLKHGQSHNAVHWTIESLKIVARTSPDLVIAVMTSLAHEYTLCQVITAMITTGSGPITEHIRSHLSPEKSILLLSTVITALGQMRDGGAFELLLPFLQHSDEKVRLVTLETIFLISPIKALPGVQSLAFDRSLRVQTRAVQLMGLARDTSSLHLLSGLLGTSQNDTVRLFAAKSIGQIASAESVPELSRAMHDLNPEIRGMAAWAAGETHNDTLLGDLLPLTRDINQLVAWSAQNAVNKIHCYCE
jgi:hypothetical protein